MAENSNTSLGVITQIVGAVLDIKFSDGNLPKSMKQSILPRMREANWLSKWHSIWVMIPFVVLPWGQRMVLCAVWKQKQPALR